MDLDPRSLGFNILFIFSSETAMPIEVKFHLYPPWYEGTNVYSNGPGYMTNMAAMPIYVKSFKTLKNLDLETWYAALCAQVLPSLFKL